MAPPDQSIGGVLANCSVFLVGAIVMGVVATIVDDRKRRQAVARRHHPATTPAVCTIANGVPVCPSCGSAEFHQDGVVPCWWDDSESDPETRTVTFDGGWQWDGSEPGDLSCANCGLVVELPPGWELVHA